MTKPGVFDGLSAGALTRGFAGALVGMVMADNGARVIRVEPSAASAGRSTGRPVAVKTSRQAKVV